LERLNSDIIGNKKTHNMTRPDIREKIISKPGSVTANIDHLIVGAPVYFGKLPIKVIECLKSINGNGKESTAIVVYGNRKSRQGEDQCIGCMACVFNCNQKARIAKASLVMKLSMKYILRKAAVERQEPLVIYP